MVRVVLMMCWSIAILLDPESNSNLKPWCFYLNKDHTKRLCFASEDDIKSLKSGKIIQAELWINSEKKVHEDDLILNPDGFLRLTKNKTIYLEDYPLIGEIQLLKGLYPTEKNGKIIVRVSLIN